MPKRLTPCCKRSLVNKHTPLPPPSQRPNRRPKKERWVKCTRRVCAIGIRFPGFVRPQGAGRNNQVISGTIGLSVYHNAEHAPGEGANNTWARLTFHIHSCRQRKAALSDSYDFDKEMSQGNQNTGQLSCVEQVNQTNPTDNLLLRLPNFSQSCLCCIPAKTTWWLTHMHMLTSRSPQCSQPKCKALLRSTAPLSGSYALSHMHEVNKRVCSVCLRELKDQVGVDQR